MSMRSLLAVLAADIDCTTLERKRYRGPLQQRAYPSTWGWLKKLPEEAETIVQVARGIFTVWLHNLEGN